MPVFFGIFQVHFFRKFYDTLLKRVAPIFEKFEKIRIFNIMFEAIRKYKNSIVFSRFKTPFSKYAAILSSPFMTAYGDTQT